MSSVFEKILWKTGLRGPIPTPPVRLHPRGPYAALHDLPRHQRADIELLDHKFVVSDGPSFYWMHQEIFADGVYDIDPPTERPVIIDCGGSYGVSTVYFKSRFPHANITVVEADPAIFSILSSNISQFDFNGVTLLNQAVAAESGQNIPFYSFGADAGRLHSGGLTAPSVSIPTISLDDLIQGRTDFLKIDIEGAETDAIRACSKLDLVDQLFIEYHSFEDSEQTLSELLDILKSNGYRYYIKTIYHPSRPYREIQSNCGMDLQLAISATRHPH
ncbi:MAG: FkbM family methyltransferase [Cyanobacteriota bacterium]|nr:FkbM family methyltransferase [Cyanobacteriota bacterium]